MQTHRTNPELLAALDVVADEPVGPNLHVSYQTVAKKDYKRLMSYANCTSYSQLSELHRCPRKLELMKREANLDHDPIENIDFAFGHAVGAGVESWMTHKLQDAALFNTFLAWSMPLDARDDKAQKSLWEAHIAVEKFMRFAAETLDDWDLLILPSGRPATEVAFSLHAEEGFKHYAHMDLALRNRRNGQIAVAEVKTTKYKEPEDAFYANSNQGVSYSLFLDTLYPGMTEYEVMYLVYSSSTREWHLLPFQKNMRAKAEAIKDIMIDHAQMRDYERIQFYPKRGEACYLFNRRCQYFGRCDSVDRTVAMPVLADEEEAEPIDYAFKLDDIVASIKGAA